jgi:hypothetical protein
MDSINLIGFLWQISLGVSALAFLFGIMKKSWVLLLISFITSLPIAYYFMGAENNWRSIALIPLLLLVLTVVYRMRKPS